MEPATWKLNDTRCKHFTYHAQLARDADLDAVILCGTSIIAIVSRVEMENIPSINWTLVLCKQTDGNIIFSNVMRKDWLLEHVPQDATKISLTTFCQIETDCHHEVRGAIAGCKIGSEWDDTMEELIDDLLSVVYETADVETVPNPSVSPTVVEGATTVMTIVGTLVQKLWQAFAAVYQGITG